MINCTCNGNSHDIGTPGCGRVLVSKKEEPKLNGSVWIVGLTAVSNQYLRDNMGYQFHRRENVWTKPLTTK